MGFELSTEYVDVAARLREFRDKHPEGSLQPADLASPFTVQKIGEQMFVVVVAAAYRTPDDPRPGIGMAYEQFPGKTPYTRNSELQNAETSAWGRAIVAALASDTRKGVSTAEDIRNRRADEASEQPAEPSEVDKLKGLIRNVATAKDIPLEAVAEDFLGRTQISLKETTDLTLLSHYLGHLRTQGIPKAVKV